MKTSRWDRVADELRAFGLTYPDAHLKSPWPGHLDLAVNDRTFAYLSAPGDPFSLSCKLPQSSEDALQLLFVRPTGYGLGKWGWITAQPDSASAPAMRVFEAWIDESYRAIAKKGQVKLLDARPSTTPNPRGKRVVGGAPALKAERKTAKARPATKKKASKSKATKQTPSVCR